MQYRVKTGILATLLATALLLAPLNARAQQQAQRENGLFFLGSVVLSLLHVPFKLATCAGTQATAAVFYVTTFGVEGHYDGGTNGRDIGETARLSCTGDWIITPQQVRLDYGE